MEKGKSKRRQGSSNRSQPATTSCLFCGISLDPRGRVSHETRSCKLNPNSRAYSGGQSQGSRSLDSHPDNAIALDPNMSGGSSETPTLTSPSRNRAVKRARNNPDDFNNADPFNPPNDSNPTQGFSKDPFRIEVQEHPAELADMRAAPTGPQPHTESHSEMEDPDNQSRGSPQAGGIPTVREAGNVEVPAQWELKDSNIRITTHPNVQKLSQMYRFKDYQPGLSADYCLESVDNEPWKPFRMCLDFELAELAQDARMNKKQTQRLIMIIWTFKFEQYESDGGAFDRRYNEPWTSDAWWEAQSKLPDGAGIFAIILHADKTKLSTFGTQKAYPIYAQCSNLPLHVQNGVKHGKEILAGLMPIVGDKHAADFSRANYPNFKRDVWTKAFLEILKSISGEFAQMYYGHDPWNKQSFSVPSWMRKVFDDSAAMNKENRNNALKAVGLRPVENVFWDFQLSDVYSALTWDHLHAYHIGLFRDHLMKEISHVVETTFGAEGQTQLNSNLDWSPHWPGLTHFSTLSTLGEIANASKFEDLSKVILFTAYPLFTSSNDKESEAYRLLKLFRTYLDLDAFASLRNPSEQQVCEGEALLQVFNNRLKSFHEVTTNEDKDWAFPKVHSHTHMFQDIRCKGATVNGNCKTFERAHQPICLNYELRTNFKNVNPQIHQMDGETAAALSIRSGIEILDELEDLQKEAELDGDDGDELAVPGYPHILLGSRNSDLHSISTTIADAPNEFKVAYENLNRKIANRLNLVDAANDYIRNFPVSHEIRQYHLIRAEHESLDDWAIKTDLIRAHKMFHGCRKYDCLVYQVTDTTVSFAHLLSLFMVEYNQRVHYFALIVPFDLRPSVTNRAKDSDFEIIRVWRRHYSNSIVIHVGSILRAACLVPAWGCEYGDEYLLNMFLDPDFWLCSKGLRDRGLAWKT
ncbi:hypothetical protein FA15DRAFT_661485 [Coprinopsis marcescibilis]|uniref:Uncharacterized protein n=1 Tax=Coprinopsis marcescibilis TaxID=230819 RepID=A0A5C3KC07_COPMA|nr:hypothetical protein FA15DRAFT_661485 [Coprinopsis marcescibilis]